MVIILAAGKGSRTGFSQSKCSVPLDKINDGSSVQRLVRQFREAGESNFVIVVGFDADNVVKSLCRIEEASLYCKFRFLYNPFYETRGSGYSLSLVKDILNSKNAREDIYVVEGDSVYQDTNIDEIVSFPYTGVLCRRSNFLSQKSVGVVVRDLGSYKRVVGFIYDKSHSVDMSMTDNIFSDGYEVLDSMQIWKIAFQDYAEFAGSVSIPVTPEDTNLEHFRRIMDRFVNIGVCMSKEPDGWVNLNTAEDFDNVSKFIEKESGLL